MKETRAQVIWRHATAFINGTGISWATYSANVAEHYTGAVPDHLCLVEFSKHHDPHKRMVLDAQTVRRFEHETKFGLPADLEDSMVMALPAGRRRALQAELAARTGLLATPIPEASEQANTASVASLMRETAEAIEAIAPMLQDGRIDHNDAHLAGHAERQILEALAAMDCVLVCVRNIQQPDGMLRQVK